MKSKKDCEKPKYEEKTAPVRLKKWTPTITDIRRLLLPGQDESNFSRFELANGRCKKHPITPFLVAEMSQKPWMPNGQIHSKALGGWEILQKTHKRPSSLDIGSQAAIAYNIRFVLAGDLAQAWQTFGGLSAQLTHLGTVMNLAIAENATIAQTYDRMIRQHANELSKFRGREKDIIKLLYAEDQRIKRDTIRERGGATTFAPRTKGPKGKGKDKDKDPKGKGKGNGKDPKGEGGK